MWEGGRGRGSEREGGREGEGGEGGRGRAREGEEGGEEGEIEKERGGSRDSWRRSRRERGADGVQESKEGGRCNREQHADIPAFLECVTSPE